MKHAGTANCRQEVEFRREREGKSFDRGVGLAFVDCEEVGLWIVANGYAFAARPDPRIDKAIHKHYERSEKKAK